MKVGLRNLKNIVLITACAMLGCATLAFSQDEDFSPEPRKKKRKKHSQSVEEAVGEEVADRAKSALFPDWPTPEFGWGLSPIVGAKYSKEYTDTSGEVSSTTFEGGLAGGLMGIPLIPGNAGLYVEPTLGYVWGAGVLRYEDEEGEMENDAFSYRRRWANLNAILLARFYKHTLTLGRGEKVFSNKNDFPTVQSAMIQNDFAVLVYSWISAHYTHRFLRIYGQRYTFSTPSSEEQDNWLHARLAVSPLDFQLDAGPGFTLNEDYGFDEDSNHFSLAKGRTDYFLAKTSLNLFWKLGASGQAKYVYASTEEGLGSNAHTKLPNESLYEPVSVAMPEDSLMASTFVGLRNLFLGFGFGWYYNLQILNMNEKNDTKSETTKSNGFGFIYSAAF